MKQRVTTWHLVSQQVATAPPTTPGSELRAPPRVVCASEGSDSPRLDSNSDGNVVLEVRRLAMTRVAVETASSGATEVDLAALQALF